MPAPPWDLIKEVVADALDLPATDRGAFLETTCAGDLALLTEVRSLLSHEESAAWMDHPVAARPLPDEALRPGERLGQYLIIARLGEGASGIVYEAEQEHPRRRIALKVLRHGPRETAAADRFAQEARVLAGLHHPGIAQLYEIGTVGTGSGARPFIAMELVGGIPLTQDARAQRLDTTQRLALFASVCDAVEHAHQLGIVHRDLKPANILVEERGRAVVLDFGIARITGQSADATMHTETGQILGSIPYLSPEQVSGHSHDADARSDVYALGVILYELLTGRRPHQAADAGVYATLRAIQEDNPMPLREADRRLHTDLEIIVSKALSRDPARRYPSAGALGADIRRFLGSLPIAARAPGRIYQARTFCRRHRALVIGSGLVAGALLAGLVGTSWQAIRATRSDAAAERRLASLRQMSHDLIFTVHNALVGVPGTAAARKLLLDQAIQQLGELTATGYSDPDMEKELAMGYFRLARAQASPSNFSLGDLPAALESYASATSLYDHYLSVRPDDGYAWRSRIDVRLELASLLTAAGQSSPAIEALHIAIDQARARAHSDPTDIGAWYGLTNGVKRLTSALASSDQPQEAARETGAVTSDLEAFPAVEPANEHDAMGIATVFLFAGNALDQAADAHGALAMYSRAMPYARRGQSSGPDGVSAALTLADLSRYRALTLQRLGDPGASVLAYQEAAAAYEAVQAIHPDSFPTIDILAQTKSSLAAVLADCGRFEEAIPHAQDAVRLAEAVHASAPTDLTTGQHELCRRLTYADLLVRWAEEAGEPAESRVAHWTEAGDWFRQVAERGGRMRSQGPLWPDVEELLSHIPEKLSRCEAAIRELSDVK